MDAVSFAAGMAAGWQLARKSDEQVIRVSLPGREVIQTTLSSDSGSRDVRAVQTWDGEFVPENRAWL